MIVKKLLMLIDRINEWVGKIFAFLLIPLMLIVVFEVLSRRIFGSPSVWTFDVSTQIYAFIFLMAAPYTLLQGRHTSVDIFTSRLNPKTRALIDIFTYLVFFFPFVFIIFIEGFTYAKLSVELLEMQRTANWEIPLYPLKSAIPVMFFLLFLQGGSIFIKKILFLKDIDMR